jgi:membrane fusion protein (multidrug efflux system)
MGHERGCKDRDRKVKMKRLYWSALFAIVILTVLARPASAAQKKSVSAQGTITASAVIVPAHVSELGFMIAGIATEIPVKEGDTVKAGQTLMVLDTTNLQFTVAEAEAGVRAAQAQLELRRREIIKKIEINYTTFSIKTLRQSVPHEVIDIEEAKVQRAQALVEIAQARLAQGTLIAPYDGVVASIAVIPGEFVRSNDPVVTIATLNDLQIETTDLSEHDITNVKIGAPVHIFIESLNQSFTGTVINVSPIANTVGGDVVFKATIAFDEQPKGLRWGMTAEVEIEGVG